MRDIDIYSGDILLDEKSYKTYKNILIYDIHTKLLCVQYHCVLGSIR